MTLTAIAAGFLFIFGCCCLGWGLYERLLRHDLEEEHTLAQAACQSLRQERNELRAENAVLRDDKRYHLERAERLLAQLYDLRREMGLAARAHTECVDMWADGGQPCKACEPLLGVRG